MGFGNVASVLREIGASQLACSIQVIDLHQNVWLSGLSAGHDFETAHRCQIRRSPAVFIAPALRWFESQPLQEGGELIELLRGVSQTIYGQGFDHRLTALEICCSLLEKCSRPFFFVFRSAANRKERCLQK